MPPRELGPRDVRLGMRAWTVNPRDLRLARGTYDPKLALPYVPLSDGVGVVVEAGSEVTRAAVGDRVAPTFSPTWLAGPPDWDAVRRTRGGAVPGVLAEELVLPEEEVVRVPPHLTDVEAASLPCTGVTAWSAVVTAGEIQPGGTVLVLGAGGVALSALQVALMAGARVVAVTSDERKAQRLHELGAEHVIVRSAEPRWGRAVRRWAGLGVDVVVETGGAVTLGESLDAVRIGGTVAIIGVAAGARAPVDVLPILMRQIRCQGVFVGPRVAFEDLVAAYTRHGLRPTVDHTVPFSDAPRAILALDRGDHTGKIGISAEREARPADDQGNVEGG